MDAALRSKWPAGELCGSGTGAVPAAVPGEEVSPGCAPLTGSGLGNGSGCGFGSAALSEIPEKATAALPPQTGLKKKYFLKAALVAFALHVVEDGLHVVVFF